MSSGGSGVAREIARIYAELDPQAEAALAQWRARGESITCQKGCAECCYLLALVLLPEAILIAEKIMEKPDWRALLPRLREAALAASYPGVTDLNYLQRAIPCVFLSADKLCTIYDVRPSACRYFYVTTPVEHCDHRFPERRVAALDTSPFQAPIVQLAAEVARRIPPLADHFTAPIPVALLFAMKLLALKGTDASALRHATRGVPTPAEWWKLHHIDRDSEAHAQGRERAEAILRQLGYVK